MIKSFIFLILIFSYSEIVLGSCSSQVIDSFKIEYNNYKISCSSATNPLIPYEHTCTKISEEEVRDEDRAYLRCITKCESNYELIGPSGLPYWEISYPGYIANIPLCASAEEIAQVVDNYHPQLQCGSIIQTTNQVLGEVIPLAGSSFKLTYFSNRVIGRKADYTFRKILSGTSPDTSVSFYKVIAFDKNGSSLDTQTYLGANQSYIYIWDGKITGEESWGSVKRIFKEIHHYSDIDYDLTYSHKATLGTLKAKKLGLGGWVPSIWHFYDFESSTLHYGNGNVRKVDPQLENGIVRISNEFGSEIYYFDAEGKIIYTKSSLTGATLVTFNYDLAGRLVSIIEPFNKVTIFKRFLNGKLKAIIAPQNKKTAVVISNNGYLIKATNPANESYEMTYNGGGVSS